MPGLVYQFVCEPDRRTASLLRLASEVQRAVAYAAAEDASISFHLVANSAADSPAVAVLFGDLRQIAAFNTRLAFALPHSVAIHAIAARLEHKTAA